MLAAVVSWQSSVSSGLGPGLGLEFSRVGVGRGPSDYVGRVREEKKPLKDSVTFTWNAVGCNTTPFQIVDAQRWS